MNSAFERFQWKLWAWAMGGPRRYGLAMWAVRLGVRMAKYLPWHPDKLGAWTRGASCPRFPRIPSAVGGSSGADGAQSQKGKP